MTLLVLDLVLYFTVVRPVSRFARRADEISKGQMDVPELPVQGHDEISILAASFNRMHRRCVVMQRHVYLSSNVQSGSARPMIADVGIGPK